MADVIGVISGVLTIFSFVTDLFPEAEDAATVQYQFRVGLDGATPPDGGGELSNAGGNIPDIRVFNEVGDFLAIQTNDDNSCDGGDVTCSTSIETDNDPNYALFTANNDAICIGWIGATFPSGDKYGSPIGEWAKTCNDEFGLGGAWYYGDVTVQMDDETATLNCAWLDANGDQPTTAYQIHFTEFAPQGEATESLEYYCSQTGTALNFRTDEDPSTIYLPAKVKPRDLAMQRVARDRQMAGLQKRFANDTRLVESSIAKHTATGLCEAEMSVGPSFVSLQERKFCHMATKTVYPFCADVESGACWNEDEEKVVTAGTSAKAAVEVPELKFGSKIRWD